MITMIDMFAGAGGVTLGAKAAGVGVAWAGNHWQAAVDLHARRHPETVHACQDLRQFDFSRLPWCPIHWSSPACQGHSEAAQPARSKSASLSVSHDSMRATAWAVVEACAAQRPTVFVVENVPQFLEWDFLPEWESCMAKLGYSITKQVLNAASWLVPQNRKRLIIVGDQRGHLRIEEPKLDPKRRTPIGSVLDFGAGQWSEIESMSKPAARRRLTHAHVKFGGRPCWGQHVSHRGAWGRSVELPSSTMTTKNQHWMVRDGEYRLLSVDETLGVMGFPRGYLDGVPRTAALRMAGNAVPPPMAAGILEQVAASL